MGDNHESVAYFLTELFRKMRSNHRMFDAVPLSKFDPVMEVPMSLIEDVSKVVMMHSYACRPVWHPYFERHYTRMTTTWRLFLQYILFLYFIVNDGISESHERFVSLLSLARSIDMFFCLHGNRIVVPYNVNLIYQFFMKEVEKDFFVGGGWNGLDEYIKNSGFLELFGMNYKPSSRAEADRTHEQLFNMLAKCVQDFDQTIIEEDEIESHERTKLMVDHILQQPEQKI